MKPRPMKRPRFDSARAERMWDAYISGDTMAAIGRREGLTPQRVSQILDRYRAGFVRCHWCGAPRNSNGET